jgi:hypothetical protein
MVLFMPGSFGAIRLCVLTVCTPLSMIVPLKSV